MRPVLLTAITTVPETILCNGYQHQLLHLAGDFDPQYYVGGDRCDVLGAPGLDRDLRSHLATFLTLVIVRSLTCSLIV